MREAMDKPQMPQHLACLLGAALSLGACDGPDKQIGQLDGESSGETQSETSDDTQGLSDSCTEAIAAIEVRIADEEANGQSCALVVRLAFETGEPIGWQLICAPPQPELSFEEAQMMSPWAGSDQSATDDAYVLYTEPGDFGGVTYVSKRSGLLFEGSIVWDGAGDINYPLELEDMTELGEGCIDTQPPQAVEMWQYNFVGGDVHDWPDEADAALEAIWQTAALYTVKAGTTVSLLTYPRAVGGFAPNLAEFVLIVDYP